MKWYTAIGVKCSGADGRFYVKTGQEEKILSGMEIQIWTSLLWAICEESEIYERVQGLMKLAFGVEERREADREEFRYCFRQPSLLPWFLLWLFLFQVLLRKIPDFAAGMTVKNTLRSCVAPNASAPS